MQTSLGATRETVNWVLTSYIVASAIAIPITGWLADQVGRKRAVRLVGDRLHHRLPAVRGRAEPDRDGDLPHHPGRRRRLPRAARPGDDVRHQSARTAWPGDGDVRRRRDDRADPRAGARRLADREFQLALGVPGQPADRRARHGDADPLPSGHAQAEAAVRPVRLRLARARLGRAADDARPRRAARLVRKLGDLDRMRARHRRPVDVRRPHADRPQPDLRAGHVQGPQFRHRPAVHGGDRRDAARRPRLAAASAPGPVRLFGSAVGLSDHAARHRHPGLDDPGRHGWSARSTRGC